MRNIDKGSAIRTIVLALALINQFLVMYGYKPIDLDGAEKFLSFVFTAFAAIWAWWKHNFISKKGKKQKELLEKHGLA
jgi:SPP1 family holin